MKIIPTVTILALVFLGTLLSGATANLSQWFYRPPLFHELDVSAGDFDPFFDDWAPSSFFHEDPFDRATRQLRVAFDDPDYQARAELQRLRREHLLAARRRLEHEKQLRRLRRGLKELEKEIDRLELARVREDNRAKQTQERHNELLSQYSKETQSKTTKEAQSVQRLQEPSKDVATDAETVPFQVTSTADSKPPNDVVEAKQTTGPIGHLQVQQEQDHTQLVFSVPGLVQQGLQISIKTGRDSSKFLEVRGKVIRRSGEEGKEGRMHFYSESSFFRSLPLPKTVHGAADIKAELDQSAGVLKISVPNDPAEQAQAEDHSDAAHHENASATASDTGAKEKDTETTEAKLQDNTKERQAPENLADLAALASDESRGAEQRLHADV